MSLNAADNLAHLASNLYLGAEELFGLRHRLAGDDLSHLELELREIIVGDLRLGLDIDGGLLRLGFLIRGGLGGSHGLHLFKYLIDIHAGEKDFRLVSHLISGRIETEAVHLVQTSLGRVKLRQNLRGGLRHEGLQKRRADGDGLHQVVEHGGQTVLLRLILGQRPGHGLVDVFVASLENAEDLGDGVGHSQLIHLLFRLLDCL